MEETSQPDLSEFVARLRYQGLVCTVALIIRGLPADRATNLRAALETPTIPSRVIAEVVSEWLASGAIEGKSRIAAETVNRHRRGGCACQKT